EAVERGAAPRVIRASGPETMVPVDVKRSGPPTTHDLVTWRVPLSAPPSLEWQQAFRAAGDSTSVVTPRGVQFEVQALTFRSGEAHIPEWIGSIDKWIAHANGRQADLREERRREATRQQQESDARRQKASDANERFKDL
ncbi:MAG TPA: hypothetical protein VFX28_14455, partial [Methylomirabilota bacterium]|nr:hypothetical protein [Methylomirabilota bacterium]